MPPENWHLLGLRDPVSSATHYAACVGAVFATALLWRLSRGMGFRARLSLGVFGVSMILLYAASGTYHALRLPPERLDFFRLLDHSAIYGLIAGTYTPAFYLLLPDRPSRRFLLGGIWALALAGVVSKWALADVPHMATVAVYLGMGWFGLFAAVALVRAVGVRGAAWGLCGGLAYTLGALADVFRWPRVVPGLFGHHEVFHLCTIAGTFCHFVFMVRYVLPFQRRAGAKPQAARGGQTPPSSWPSTLSCG